MLEEDIEGPLPFKGCIVEFTPAVGNRSGHTVAKHARVLQDRVHPSAIAERQAQMLQEATGRQLERLTQTAQRLVKLQRVPSYIHHPKQFLVHNVFKEHCVAPYYRTTSSGKATCKAFWCKVAIPWLVDVHCKCGAGRKKAVTDGEIEVSGEQEIVTQVDVDAQIRLWRDAFNPNSETGNPFFDRQEVRSCFCHAAYGYALTSSRKEVPYLLAPATTQYK
jgi:hypothetical protein